MHNDSEAAAPVQFRLAQSAATGDTAPDRCWPRSSTPAVASPAAYRQFSNDDLMAIYNYLRTIPAVENRVPEPWAPVAAAMK